MQSVKHKVEKVYEIVALTADWLTAIVDNNCDYLELIPLKVCLTMSLAMKNVWLVVLNALHTTTIILNHKYEVDTLGDGQVWDTHLTAIDTAKHL